MKTPTEITKWLLESEKPWVIYRTNIDLLNLSEQNSVVKQSRKEMITHPKIQTILKELHKWPGRALKRHNDADHPIHKLSFLADLGFNKTNSDIQKIVTKVFKHQTDNGPFEILINVPKHFGGSGKDEISWMFCDAVVVLYCLIKLGYEKHPKVQKSLKYLLSLQRDNGWPCKAAEKFGPKFRGPGRKDDPCPYVNFYMVKVISLLPELHKTKKANIGVETLFQLWEDRKKRKPYLFGMGTDFKKLKAPFVWYDILHFLDVLTKFKHLKNDKNLKELLSILKDKVKHDPFLKPESAYRAWKEWDFGQKREPSHWITFLAYRVLSRM